MSAESSSHAARGQEASSSSCPPLPTLKATVFDVTSEPSPSDLAEMIAVLRGQIEKLRPCAGDQCSELVALERALHLLHEQFHRRTAGASSGGSRVHSAIERARQLADTFRFEVPESHRDRIGKTVTATKRAILRRLAPFHMEVLRPQRQFNFELLAMLETVVGRAGTNVGVDLSDSIRRRLGSISDPTAWTLRTHRSGLAASGTVLAKKSFLVTLDLPLRDLLSGQRQWNEKATELLAAAGGTVPLLAKEAYDATNQLRELVSPLEREGLSSLVKLSRPIWAEVLRRQIAFNHAIADALSQHLGTHCSPKVDYSDWCGEVEPREIEDAQSFVARLASKPLISVVVPAFESSEPEFRACIESVFRQSYDRWELIVVDDGSTKPVVAGIAKEYAARDRRVTFRRFDTNRGIAAATNEAIRLSSGDWVAFLDHDDTLAGHALAEVVRRLQSDPAVDLVYTDEDRIDGQGKRLSPFFKPGWSPDLLRSGNYICHFLVVSRKLLDEVSGLRDGFQGAQDYDLVLRLTERSQRVGHIPRVLYHWRCSATSTAMDTQQKPEASAAGARALAEHLARAGVEAKVETPRPTTHRVRYPIRGQPLVSIVVPFKDKPELLRRLVDSVLANTHYSNFELLLISNNSTQPETFEALESFSDPRIRKLKWDHPFNYSAINNYGAAQARGELLLFLNNDIEAIDPNWLHELISQAQRPEIGAVGAKLLFPNGTIQHAGVVLGLGGFAGHALAGLPDDARWTAFGHTEWVRNYLAVTSACVMMRREVYDAVGGYDETFVVCGSDVDLCLKMIRRGLRVIYTPYARLVHHESATRRLDAIPENDFWRSYASYRPWLRGGDPYYNSNLSLECADGSLRCDQLSAEARAVRVLSHELRGSRVPPVSVARERHVRHVMDHVRSMDYTPALVQKARAKAHENQLGGPIRTINWLVPYFAHPFGGVHTILRFGYLLGERHGVESRFVIYDNPGARERDFEAKVSPLFARPPGTFKVMKSWRQLRELPPADLGISTLWSGAYLLLQMEQTARRAYFVQDFEPYFYPAGSMYALAEQTYHMGFYGIFNTKGLHDYVTSHYPMAGTWFEPSVEHALFHDRRPVKSRPVRIFFYGRPSSDRNAFELGVLSLIQLKRNFGGAIDIVSAGEHWNPEEYGASGAITNLGVLPYEKTADLYRECDIGLCFMFTKHPSYLPFELMASGVTVVSNNNPANSWLFESEKNCLLAEPVTGCVLAQLRRAVREPELRCRIGTAAAERIRGTTWEEQVDRVYAALTRGEPIGGGVSSSV